MDGFHEVTVSRLAYGGDALGRLESGQAVFVPFALPGERVRVRVVEQKKGHARAELREVLEASAERVQPRCVHFGICGGCHYQHMPYEAQLRAKAEILWDQLQRIGQIDSPPVRATVPSPNPWNYRNHVQFHLTPEGKVGYYRHPEAPPEGVFAISECHLPEPALNELWPQLGFEAGAPIERVSLRAGEDLMLVLEADSPEPPEMEVEAEVSVVHLFRENPVVMAGEGRIRIEVLGRSFQVSAGSFFQVNTAMAGRMVKHVLERLPGPVGTVLDLYCGVGLFSAFLAPRCERLVGIESSASACEDFAANLDEFDHVELYEGRVEEILPHLDIKPEVVIADPPRAGLDRRVIDALLERKPGMIAYVSCDPSTLARDAARLIRGGFELVEVTPFDLFPQTFHIESISIFNHR